MSTQPHAFYVTVTGDGEITPTTNGTRYTPSQEAAIQCTECQVYVEFYSNAAGTLPVTPTAGTLTVDASPLGNNYLAASNSSVIDATTVSTPNGTYTPPIFNGRVFNGRCTFSGIAGAPFARVLFYRE